MPNFKAYDKVLGQWFQASTKAELLALMNQPRVVARRQAAMQLQAIVDDENDLNAIRLADAKRFRKNQHRLKAPNVEDT